MKKILMVLAGIIISLTFSISAAWGGNEYYYDTLYGRDAGNGYTGVPTPYYNTFIGAGAGYFNYTSNTAHGSNDVFLGYGSGYNNTSGYDNVFAGYESGSNNNTGYYNSFVGSKAGFNNSIGVKNTFVGYNSGYTNTDHADNTFIGNDAGYKSNGWANAMIGSEAGYSNTTHSWNIYIGYQAGYKNDGDSNVFIGTNAGYYETAASNKLYISNSDTSTPLIWGDFSIPKVQINGSLEVINGIIYPDGRNAIPGLTSSLFTSMGYNAGISAGTNGGDVFIGANAGVNNASGSYNTFVGQNAGHNNVSGYYNSYFGSYAGTSNTGSGNSFFGTSSGFQNISGSSNSFFGSYAGYTNTGSGNVFIGNHAGYNEPGDNKLYIANSSTATPLIGGDFGTGIVQINGQLVFPSDERLKKNIEPLKSSLDKVAALNGVSYEWKAENTSGRDRQIGLIAQEVEAFIPEVVYTDNKGYKSLAYDRLVPVLVEAVKEQQKAIDEKNHIVAEQKTALDALTAKLEKLETRLNRLEGRGMSAQK
jgi:uncharacterized coiled-coil protein SlyX